MTIKLPKPIEDYLRFSAEGSLKDATDTFTAEAAVFDNGEDTKVVGREAIYEWLKKVAAQYSTTVEVVNLSEKSGEAVVTALVSGNFAGSPAEFEYRFVRNDGLIERLVIDFVGFK